MRVGRLGAALLLACSWLCSARVDAQLLQLSLPDALERVNLRSPEVVLAEAAVREVQARRAGAGIVLPVNPRLAVELRPSISGAPVSDFGYSATLDAQFDLGGAPSARVREVERDVELARAQGETRRLEARLLVVATYYNAQLAQLRIAETHAALDIARRVLNAAQTRIDVGAGSDFERASAQLELSRIEASEQAALRELDEQRMALRDLLDLPAQAAIELTTQIDVPPQLQALGYYLQQAERSHPELVLSRARLGSLAASRERLERETFPKLGVYAGVDAAPLSPVFGVLGVSGELPFAQRNQGPRAVVARATETEHARHEIQVRRIARDVTGAFNALERRRAEFEVLTQAALPAAERSFELAEAGWRAGRFDWFRVALAARDLIELRAQRVAALAALWTQRIALARARGADAP
jgi:outer membrane protein TolC